MNIEPTADARSAWTRALVARLVRGSPQHSAAGGPPRPRTSQGPAPLSAAQARLRLLHDLDPDGASYNEALAIRLRGTLRIAALEASLREIASRHEILRSTFPIVDGTPVQCATARLPESLRLVDLSRESEDRTARALALAESFARRPFDLTTGPPFDTLLLRIAEDDHLLVIACHHIVADHWAMATFIEELGACYAAFAAGSRPSLPAPPLQYADFAVWQRAWLASGDCEHERAFWMRTLEGAPLSLDLPADHSRPSSWSYRGGHVTFQISPATTERVRRAAREAHGTMFMVLVAAFELLLHRYAGQRDLLVGTVVAGREHASLERLLGFFLNSVVLRSRYAPDDDVRTFLTRCRETCLAAFAHRRLPFERLVEALNPPRDGARNPIFQSMLILQNAPTRTLTLPDLSAEIVRLDFGITKLDLYLFLEQTDDRIDAVLRYSTDLFEPATAARLASGYQTLLEAMLHAPDARVVNLPLMTADEHRRLLVDWNDTTRTTDGRCVHELFEQQTRRTPTACAVIGAGRSFTYDELDRRATIVAHALRRRGADRGRLVAIAMRRSPDLVVALLAVLKSGAAYLPLDPRHPPARLRAMLDDAEPAVLLTERALAHDFADAPPEILCLDAIADGPDDGPVDGLDDGAMSRALPIVSPFDAAYVLYTSGSTGQPKGVEIPHRALVNFLHSMREEPGLTSLDTIAAVTTITFDIAGLEIWLPLIVGGRIAIADEETLADGAALASLLRESNATVMQSTPATWRLLLEAGWSGAPTFRAMCGGEAFPPDLVSRLRACCGAVWNLYGPTETTIWSLACPVIADEPPIPIGRPIANTQVFVLDAAMQPVPIGMTGELYLGGHGLAHGYRRRPRLTAERFVPHPFSTSGERLYRTGDLARWRGDGQVDYLGRIDHQVKVRGFRIEPGEIEHVLARQPGVRHAVVLAHEYAPGDTRLIAWIVCGEPAAFDLAPVRLAIDRALPDYMRPHPIVPIDRLPLTPSGKVDRRALLACVPTLAAPGPDEAPITPIEVAIARVWAEVLGSPSIGRTDHFFELGGHSLLAMQVVRRLRDVLGVELPVRALFDEPTVSGLAREVERRGPSIASGSEPLTRVEREAPLPLSFGQQRLWVLDRLLAQEDRSAYNVPAAVMLSGPLDVTALGAALDAVIARHEALRTAFPADADGHASQIVVRSLHLTLPVDDETGTAGRALMRLVAREAEVPFDLTRPPLLRARLFRTNADEHVLVLVLHHIVFDGWSAGVLVRELASCYARCLEGGPIDLPPLTIQYPDYALWQRRVQTDAQRARQLEFWRTYLSDTPVLLPLATDHPRPLVQDLRGAHVRCTLDASAVEAIEAFGRARGVTLFMTAMAAWALVLSHLSGEDILPIGTDVAGRDRPELEALIGFLTNQVVLRVDLTGEPTVDALLARLRDTTLDAIAHADIPFDQVVEWLQPERSRAWSPLFQAKLVLQDLPVPEMMAGDLRVMPLEVDSETTRFDLLMNLSRVAAAIHVTLSYRTSLFTTTTASRIAGLFERLLRELPAHGDRPIAELRRIVSESDRTLRAAAEAQAARASLGALATARRRPLAITHE